MRSCFVNLPPNPLKSIMLISTTFEIIQNVSPPRGLIAGIKFHLKFDLPEVPEIITVQIFDILSLRGSKI